MCLIVFIKSKPANTATGIHLTCLAVADSFILMSLFVCRTQQWVKYIDIPDLTSFSYIICTLPYYTISYYPNLKRISDLSS